MPGWTSSSPSQAAARADAFHASAQPDDDIRVAVLDDHMVVRFGIELLVGNAGGLVWAGAAASTAEVLRLLARTACHVLVLDYQLSPGEMDGSGLVRHLRAHFPHVRLLAYTSYGGDATAAVLRQAGVHGFVGKSAGLEKLLDAIRRVAAGEAVFPSETPCGDTASEASGAVPLTPRENEVLRCCRQGMSVTDIARKFVRSVKTVSAQKQSGYRKLGVRTDHDFLVKYADALPGSGHEPLKVS